MNIKIRKAKESDAEVIASIGLDLSHRSTVHDTKKFIEKLDDKSDCGVYVACTEEEVVGWVHVAMRNMLVSGSTVEIIEIAVKKGLRRSGIGKMLIDKVKEWATGRGGVILVRTGVRNIRANQFYGSIGMEKVSEQCVYTMDLKT